MIDCDESAKRISERINMQGDLKMHVCDNCGRRFNDYGESTLMHRFCCKGCKEEWNRKHSSSSGSGESGGAGGGCLARIKSFINLLGIVLGSVILIMIIVSIKECVGK